MVPITEQPNEPQMDLIDLTDEIMPSLNRSATKIQKIVRGRQGRKFAEDKKYMDDIMKAVEEETARIDEQHKEYLQAFHKHDFRENQRQNDAATNAATTIAKQARKRLLQ